MNIDNYIKELNSDNEEEKVELNENSWKEKTFYHSHTFLPIDFSKETNDNDSDIEFDTEYLKEYSADKLSDQTSYSIHCNLFMNKWNEFIFYNPILYDSQVSQRCVEFARKYKHTLSTLELYYEFLKHIVFLFEDNLITEKCVCECLSILQKLPVVELKKPYRDTSIVMDFEQNEELSDSEDL